MKTLLWIILLLSRYVVDGADGLIPVDHGILQRHARQADEDCSWNVSVGSGGGTLKSPGYPGRYPSNVDCRWVLTTDDPNATILLKMDAFDLEPAKECQLDYLQVYLGSTSLSPSLGPFCGKMTGKVIPTNSSTLLVIFHSDPGYEETGFSIDYYTQTPGDCERSVRGTSGWVNSPGFPGNYPDGSDCWTQVEVPEGKVVMLRFSTLDLEFDENCTYDYVSVFDGSSRESPELGRFCSSSLSPGGREPMLSSSNLLLLHFHSDHLVNRKGFRAQYSAVEAPLHSLKDIGGCQWEGNESNGTVTSPNYPQKYPSDSDCSLWLRAPPRHTVALVFDALQLEVEANCSYDYLRLLEGPSTAEGERRVIGTYCGRLSEPREVNSTGNEMQIVFHSDDFAEFSGFKARYTFHTNETEVKRTKEEEETVPKLLGSNSNEITFSRAPRNASLALGGSLVLPCATTHPTAKIRWLKDDRFVGGSSVPRGLQLGSDSSLWIQSMSEQLAGVYTCAAVSPERTEYARAWITVEKAGENETACNIAFRKVPRDSSFAEGEFAHLECLAAGGSVRMSWEKEGLPLLPKRHLTVLPNGFLFLEKVALEDAGLYSCVAHDDALDCRKRATARLSVSKRANIEQICGLPKVGQPSKDKPHLEHGKIVGGHDTKKGAYPWQVMLWEPTLKSFCGGTLLNERWIATAAHCFTSYKGLQWDQVVVKLGKHDREREEREEVRTGIADPSSIVIHPAYGKATFDNDLALVRLRDHVRFTDHVLPACLGNDTRHPPTTSSSLQLGTVVGWGKLKQNGASPRFLQEIRLPVVDQDTCVRSTSFTVSRNMFCAGYSQAIVGDACQGDSGGPFLVSRDGRWFLEGIVSWGEGCGDPDKYGFYTKVPNYLLWIKGIIRS